MARNRLIRAHGEVVRVQPSRKAQTALPKQQRPVPRHLKKPRALKISGLHPSDVEVVSQSASITTPIRLDGKRIAQFVGLLLCASAVILTIEAALIGYGAPLMLLVSSLYNIAGYGIAFVFALGIGMIPFNLGNHLYRESFTTAAQSGLKWYEDDVEVTYDSLACVLISIQIFAGIAVFLCLFERSLLSRMHFNSAYLLLFMIAALIYLPLHGAVLGTKVAKSVLRAEADVQHT